MAFRSVGSLLYLCSLVAWTRGQIPGLGFCPEYAPMKNFEMDRFLGKWYEAERYFNLNEVGVRCVVVDYAKASSGRIYISNEYTNRFNTARRVINGNIVESSRDGDQGKFKVKYPGIPMPSESTLVVLDTDYDTYAVVWSCNGYGPIHTENAWVLTRDRLPAGAIHQKAYGALDKFRINHSFLVKTEQEGCSLAASDINASQGITSVSTIAEQTGHEERSSDKGKSKSGAIPAVVKEAQKQDAAEVDTTNEEEALRTGAEDEHEGDEVVQDIDEEKQLE